VGVVDLVVLACVLRATTKGRKKKSAPPEKILATPMLSGSLPSVTGSQLLRDNNTDR